MIESMTSSNFGALQVSRRVTVNLRGDHVHRKVRKVLLAKPGDAHSKIAAEIKFLATSILFDIATFDDSTRAQLAISIFTSTSRRITFPVEQRQCKLLFHEHHPAFALSQNRAQAAKRLLSDAGTARSSRSCWPSRPVPVGATISDARLVVSRANPSTSDSRHRSTVRYAKSTFSDSNSGDYEKLLDLGTPS
jgi:hypothetical protein